MAKVNGRVRDISRRVYQRSDIDINLVDEVKGMKNLERMQSGCSSVIELYFVC